MQETIQLLHAEALSSESLQAYTLRACLRFNQNFLLYKNYYRASQVGIHFLHTFASPNIRIQPFTVYTYILSIICIYVCEHSMQHIRTLSLNSILVKKGGIFHQRKTCCPPVFVSPLRFQMATSSASQAQKRSRCKGCSGFKIIFLSPAKHWLGVYQHWQAITISISANTMQSMHS